MAAPPVSGGIGSPAASRPQLRCRGPSMLPGLRGLPYHGEVDRGAFHTDGCRCSGSLGDRLSRLARFIGEADSWVGAAGNRASTDADRTQHRRKKRARQPATWPPHPVRPTWRSAPRTEPAGVPKYRYSRKGHCDVAGGSRPGSGQRQQPAAGDRSATCRV
jgi:hypothetical protein